MEFLSIQVQFMSKTILYKPKRADTSVVLVQKPKRSNTGSTAIRIAINLEKIRKGMTYPYRGDDQPAVYDNVRQDKRLSNMAWAKGIINL